MIACSYSQKKLQKVSKQLSSCNVLILCHGYIIVCSTVFDPSAEDSCKVPPFLFDFSIKDSKLSEQWDVLSKQAERATGNSSVSNASKESSLQGLNLWWLWSEQIEVVNVIFKVVLKDLMWKVLCCYIGWELKWNINIWFLQLSY